MIIPSGRLLWLAGFCCVIHGRGAVNGYPASTGATKKSSFYFPDDPVLTGHTVDWRPDEGDLQSDTTLTSRSLSSTQWGLPDSRARFPTTTAAAGSTTSSLPIIFPETMEVRESWRGSSVPTQSQDTRTVTATTQSTSTATTHHPDFTPNCSSVDEPHMNTYGICSVLNDYPEDVIRRELEGKFGQMVTDLLFFDSGAEMPVQANVSSDSLPVFHAEDFTTTEILSSRGGITPDLAASDTPMCSYDTKPLRVQAAKNTNDTWRVIVNDRRYVQTVHAELCRAEGEPCSGLKDIRAAFGMETVCKQKYTSRRLLAVKKADVAGVDNELVTVMEYFRLPSCCVCYTRKRLNSLSRSGFSRR
ncbi:unnamed protein product [Notodromas monacha]|uniref:Spaetzle domain-containing protein n=1 Tax=Notodromas monacha TaxID=399045 RepID=A0A7R9BHI0_9CRUS|nr:unnamed protein product [Notodromas monacha]CAG0914178.1 unnamed protein product [Notodromas monacha]